MENNELYSVSGTVQFQTRYSPDLAEEETRLHVHGSSVRAGVLVRCTGWCGRAGVRVWLRETGDSYGAK